MIPLPRLARVLGRAAVSRRTMLAATGAAVAGAAALAPASAAVTAPGLGSAAVIGSGPVSALLNAVTVRAQVVSTAPGQVTVSWLAPTAIGVRQWQVVLRVADHDGSMSRWVFAPPSARSIVVDNLPTGATVRAGVAVYTGSSTTSWSAVTPSTRVASGLCDGVSTACVAADGTAPLGPERHVAQGFVHGLDLTPTGVAEVRALSPRWWRISEPTASEWNAVANFPAVATTALLSDAWLYWTYNPATRRAQSPWENWGKYASFIAAEVRKRVAAGQVPAYWEIQNEPDVNDYYDPAFPPTTPLVLEQFNVAYHAIKSVLPAAKIIGPSLGGDRLVGDTTHVGLQDFIDYATANRLYFAAVSWHELNAGDGWAPHQQLPGLPDRVEGIRAELDHSPVLAGAQIFVNEYDSPPTARLVGWDLGHVVALEQAGVDEANHSCFAGCYTRDAADGLLDADGQTPRMTYWGRMAYAAMSGARMAATSSAHDTTVLAANGGSAESMTALVTRHHGCSVTANTSMCPSGSFQPPADTGPLTAVLRLPRPPDGRAASRATLTVTLLSNTTGDQPAMPSPIVDTTVGVGPDGVVRTQLPSLADGAAYVITVAWSGLH